MVDADSVLHVIAPEPLGGIGGADLHVLELALTQKRRSFLKPNVLITENEEFAVRLEEAGIPFTPGHTRRNLWRLIPWLKGLPSRSNIKIIHSHGYDADYLTYLLNLLYPSTWGKIPIVMTCHGWIETSLFLRIKTKLNFAVYGIAKALIVCGEDSLRRLAKHGTKAFKVYIPNGIFPAEESVVSSNGWGLREHFELPKSCPLIGIVGRLSAEKRIDVFLEACAQIERRVASARFLVVGSGPQRNRLEQVADFYGIGSKVIFTGYVPKINAVYRELSLLILSSDSESTPRAVIEAMSHGLPVIATNVGSLGELVVHEKTGYLVDRGDSMSIARYAVELLRDDSQRIRLGSQGRARFKKYFSIWQMQEAVDMVYRKVLATHQ